ncbi:hypothetical protein ABZY10_26765 [Streptomyces sp. NPDC006539]|uniref:hypothetical protein n=1 Tax=Streptomyces sp. NPDC006539 TaxID=3155352 RepID=UPI0033BB7E54
MPIPSTKARATYVELLRKDSGAQSEQAQSGGSSECPADGIREDRELMDELLAMGMVREDASSPSRFVAVEPGIVEARIGALLRSSALTMLEEARNLTDLLRPLIVDSRHTAGPQGGESIVRIQGKAAISAIVNESVQQSTSALFTAQPGGRPAQGHARADPSADRRAARPRGGGADALPAHRLARRAHP